MLLRLGVTAAILSAGMIIEDVDVDAGAELARASTASVATSAPRVSLIGDSTMAAMSWYRYDNADADTAANNDIREIVGNSYDLVFSAESCRRLVSPSCNGRFGYTPRSALPLMQTTLAGQLGEALVVMAGYDDPSISRSIDLIVAEAQRQGVERVLWLNYRTTTRYVLPGGLSARTLYERHNAELVSAATRHPSLQILDWNGSTAGRSSWFTGDGIHLTTTGAVGLAQYVVEALARQPLGRCRAAVASTGDVVEDANLPAAPAGAPGGFTPARPVRVLDTRDPQLGGAQGKVGAGRTVSVGVGDIVASGATDVVLSVTAVDACADGFVTVHACAERPGTSNINVEVGRTTAGMVVSALDVDRFCVFSSTTTDLVIDAVGSFGAGGERFRPMTPTRWVDTRGNQAVTGSVGIQTTASEIEIPMRGVDSIPAQASAVWINLTAAEPTASTVLLAYPGPCGSAPLASTVNARSGQSAASSTLVELGSNGSICVRTVTGRSHVLVDVAGWFGAGSDGLRYLGQLPTRLLDTRTTAPAASANEAIVPTDAVAVLNIVSTESTAPGFVSARPCGTTQVSSLLNVGAGETLANLTVVAPGAGGAACVRSNVPAHLVVDRTGSFVP